MRALPRCWLWLTITATACVAGDDEARVASEVAVAGRWIAPPSTQAIAATQHVSVVDPPAVSPLGRCTSSNAFACSCTHPACMPALPGTRELDAYLRRRWSFLRAGGTYCCRQNSATTSVPRLSVHSLGRAIDLMVPMDRGDADNTLGDQVANWLVENAEHVGIQRVVWDRSYWNGERGFGALGSGSLPHTDHLHVELSLDGAARRTPFFTSGASTGTSCTPRCDGTRVIDARCAATECATQGATCVDGPPRCGAPPPPEPAAAARVANPARPTLAALTDPLRVTLLAPSRRFDTRTPSESTRLLRDGAAGPLAANATDNLRDWSGAGLPDATGAVWMNLTAVSLAQPGFITAWAEGTTRPETSTLNFAADEVRANAAVIPLGQRQGVSLSSLTPTHLIGDLAAAFAPAGTGLTLLAPTRLYDTRATSIPLRANEIRAVEVPRTTAAAGVLGTVAVVSRGAPGFLQVFPCGRETTTSVTNFAPMSVSSNAFVSALGEGRLCLRANTEVDAIVDLVGRFSADGAFAYRPLSPRRLLDTRGAQTFYTGRLAARQVIELPIQSLPGAPAMIGAVSANVTAVGATEHGYLSVFPCGGGVPTSSSLNFAPDAARSTLVTGALGGGALCVFSSARAHLIVDLLGVWVPIGTAPPPSVPPEMNPDDGGDDLPEPRDAGTSQDATSQDATSRDVTSQDVTSQDATSQDVTARDATSQDLGATVSEEPPTVNGCACRTTRSDHTQARPGWAAALLLCVRRRRRGSLSRG